VLNLVVAFVLTVVFRALRLPAGSDETMPAHYLAGADDAVPEPEPSATAAAGAT
jgi:hypothetical protein